MKKICSSDEVYLVAMDPAVKTMVSSRVNCLLLTRTYSFLIMLLKAVRNCNPPGTMYFKTIGKPEVFAVRLVPTHKKYTVSE